MFPGGKGGRCLGPTSLPPSCAECLEIWMPHPPGTLRSCPGIALPLPLPYRSILPGLNPYLGFQVVAGWSLRFSEDCRAPTSSLHGVRRNMSTFVLIFVLRTFLCFNICAADILMFWYLCCGHSCFNICAADILMFWYWCCGHSCFNICAADILVLIFVPRTFLCFNICAADILVF